MKPTLPFFGCANIINDGFSYVKKKFHKFENLFKNGEKKERITDAAEKVHKIKKAHQIDGFF